MATYTRQAKGSSARFSYVNEAAWGTTPADPAMKQIAAAVYGESLGGSAGELSSNAIRTTRGRAAIRGGDFTVGGSVPFEMAPLGLASLIKNALGAAAAPAGAGPYTHVIKRGDLPPGMTIEKAFTDVGRYFIFRGVLIDRFAFNINGENSLVTGSMDVVGKSFEKAEASLGVPTAVTHAPFAHFEAAIEVDGAPVECLNMGMTITNEIERVGKIGSRFAAKLNEGSGAADVNLTLLFDRDDHVDKWLAETAAAVEVTMTYGAHSLTFLLPQLKYVGDSVPKIATPQGIVVELTGRAEYNAAEATDVKVTVVNTEATI